MSDKNILDTIKYIEEEIEVELNKLTIPKEYIEIEKEILSGREEDSITLNVPISENEHSTFSNLQMNNSYRVREVNRAMGTLLLYYHIGPVRDYWETVRNGKADESEHFWSSYGSFLISSYSLLDGIGVYLSFVFFGLFDAPLYFNQVIEAIKLKYSNGTRRILEGDPFNQLLLNNKSWGILLKAKEKYNAMKQNRNEFAHVFSPLMYKTFEDEDWLNNEIHQFLKRPDLNAEKAINECKGIYFLLRLAPLAADNLASLYIGSGSYHRDFYW